MQKKIECAQESKTVNGNAVTKKVLDEHSVARDAEESNEKVRNFGKNHEMLDENRHVATCTHTRGYRL